MQERSDPKMQLRRFGSRTAYLWRKGHREALQDMRANWLVFLIILFWLGGLIASIVILSLIATIYTQSNFACKPDGSFSVLDDTPFSYWSSSGFFQITLGFGTLSFSQAKIIDVIWDIVRFTPFVFP